MPFIGKDWRSPGEVWIKTDIGWERKKIFESLNRNMEQRLCGCDSETGENMDGLKNDGSNNVGQPYCQIIIKCTREVAGFNIISEVFKMLDFQNAIRDVRRFKYMCKIMHLLITQNLNKLGGNATKILFTMLEEIAFYVSSSQSNIHILHKLLQDLKKVLYTYRIWGCPLGSTLLWNHHQQTLDRISGFAQNIQIKQRKDDGSSQLTDMPEEIVREILLRLSDHKDLQQCGEAYNIMQGLIDEQHIWRQLCKYHFSKQQVEYILEERDSRTVRDWQQVYHKLRRKFGMREEYADTLYLCRQCHCLFWKSTGHPCKELDASSCSDNEDDSSDDDRQQKYLLHIPIPPEVFLTFFSL